MVPYVAWRQPTWRHTTAMPLLFLLPDRFPVAYLLLHLLPLPLLPATINLNRACYGMVCTWTALPVTVMRSLSVFSNAGTFWRAVTPTTTACCRATRAFGTGCRRTDFLLPQRRAKHLRQNRLSVFMRFGAARVAGRFS